MTQVLSTRDKVDFYKGPAFFRAPRKPELVELPEASFLVVDGEGSPDGQAFQDAIGSLYSVAYTIKMTGKSDGHDFRVPTFEGAWWIAEDGQELPRDKWRWQLVMMVPDFVDAATFNAAVAQLVARKKPLLTPVRLERIRRGMCVQVMHVGPYDAEPATIAKIMEFAAQQGVEVVGPHLETYLGDPRRAKPEALKTILRYRVKKS
jgi:hypothetical protein